METLFDNGIYRVKQNTSDEVFIELCANGCQVRISTSYNHGFLVTAMGSIMTPTSINGLDAFRVRKI